MNYPNYLQLCRNSEMNCNPPMDDQYLQGIVSSTDRAVKCPLNVLFDKSWKWYVNIPRLINHRYPPPAGHRQAYMASVALRMWDCLMQFWHLRWVLLKDPFVSPWKVFPDIFNPNMLIYIFRTCHMNFTQKEHVILDKIH